MMLEVTNLRITVYVVNNIEVQVTKKVRKKLYRDVHKMQSIASVRIKAYNLLKYFILI